MKMKEQFSISTAYEAIKKVIDATNSLTLFHNVLNDAAGEAVLNLLRTLIDEQYNAVAIARAYSRAFRELALAVGKQPDLGLADAWQAYLVARIIEDTNPWSSQVEYAGIGNVSATLRAQAQKDLSTLRLLFGLHAQTVWQLTSHAVAATEPALCDAWVPWLGLAPTLANNAHPSHALAALLAESDDWATLVEPLESYWSRYGTGLVARYPVLRWQATERALHGIAYPDPIQLEGLVGYEREKALLITNTERFMAGLPAHDVLLYGSPGTGKSSAIKALANRYADQGLRLVEVRKETINSLPEIVAQLRERAPHFVLFIDDLSFEDQETAYKGLKVFLEGTVEVRPANILIYATTNRFNVIRENFAERGKQSEDVHWRDTMDEKLSLVARFGLRITFITPDQDHYLRIVFGLAQQRSLTLPEEALRTRALQWERQHIGRSGRVARQFIDTLEAELRETTEKHHA